MTDTSIEHVAVTCTVELSASVVDAGAILGVKVITACSPPCDLEGETVAIHDSDGRVVASGTLGAYDEKTESNSAEISVPAPLAPGDHQWSAHLAAYADEEVAYDAVTARIAFATKAHTSTVLVWDVPTATVAGEPFTLKVGIKCSSGCRQAHRAFTIVDRDGNEVAASRAGEAIWPKSEALYFTEVEVRAPGDVGLMRWEARVAEADIAAGDTQVPLAHTAAIASFDVRSVKRPDHRVRLEAWDGEKQEPLAGARVVLHPYGAVTDEHGIAELDVAAGDYQVFVSRTKYTTYGAPVTINADLDTRIELFREPPPNRE
jgi:hypothetical protein